MRSSLVVLLFSILLGGCTSAEELEYEQYLVNGEILYKEQCANCHGEKGEGLRNLYPALQGSDRLKKTTEVICLIKNGIKADQAKSSQAMPPNPELFDLDIAQLVTFLNDEFTNKSQKVTANEVKEILSECKP
jgi:mono/diheme cytochrome c family protein